MATTTKSATARVKFVRMAPNKVRFVLNIIRGKHVDEARRILQFTPKAACPEILKLVNAAVANATNTYNFDPDTLVVAACWADEGPTLKRWQPRALGRAYQILKRTSHITVVVEPREG
ncbi:MAG TPA: 50S ribosomal protein L22 [Burkholderiales bacterium]|nr:50S ribosomal protein L22 [Burkholderiales bacterium]